MGRKQVWEGDTQAARNTARMRAYRAANPGSCKCPEHDNRRRPERMKHGGDMRVERDFIAIDGEALGEHGYHLLAASTGEEIANRDGGLSSHDCIRFLIDLRKKHGPSIFVGYALGYDCEHWIRDLGEDVWRSFRDHSEATITVDGWERIIQYIPRKWFKIGFRGKTGAFIPLVEVYDIFTFFQMSFVKALREWGCATEEELAFIADWKALRGAFSDDDWEEIRRYNQMECDCIVRLCSKLRAALEEIDIHLRSWHGPGAVANALLMRYNMKEHIGAIPEEVKDAVSRAYFGGRFQVFRFGHIEGVYDYDVSSAYPYATTLLPSTQGRWESVDAWSEDTSPWTLYLISWEVEAGAGDLTPFPWRTEQGQIHYPTYGRGWYWHWEVSAAKRGWGDAIRVERGWQLLPLEEGVFSWMKELAAKRVEAKQQAKRSDISAEQRERWQGIARAYKLALNSVYGKTIQTVGKHRPFLNPVWAGLITANTRAKMMNAAIQDKENLVCFATDGLFATAPNASVQLGSCLGDWELAASDTRLELYQSGCYSITKDGEQLDTRFRGVSRADVPWDELREVWRKDGHAGTVTVSCKRFVGHRTALQHNKPEQQCQWVTIEKEIDLHPGVGIAQGEGDSISWLSMWPPRDYNEVSHTYRKLLEGYDEEMDEENVQP